MGMFDVRAIIGERETGLIRRKVEAKKSSNQRVKPRRKSNSVTLAFATVSLSKIFRFVGKVGQTSHAKGDICYLDFDTLMCYN